MACMVKCIEIKSPKSDQCFLSKIRCACIGAETLWYYQPFNWISTACVCVRDTVWVCVGERYEPSNRMNRAKREMNEEHHSHSALNWWCRCPKHSWHNYSIYPREWENMPCLTKQLATMYGWRAQSNALTRYFYWASAMRETNTQTHTHARPFRHHNNNILRAYVKKRQSLSLHKWWGSTHSTKQRL